MKDDDELTEMLDWLKQLRDLPDEDFSASARPYFDDTQEMRSLLGAEGREGVTTHIAKNYNGKHRA